MIIIISTILFLFIIPAFLYALKGDFSGIKAISSVFFYVMLFFAIAFICLGIEGALGKGGFVICVIIILGVYFYIKYNTSINNYLKRHLSIILTIFGLIFIICIVFIGCDIYNNIPAMQEQKKETEHVKRFVEQREEFKAEIKNEIIKQAKLIDNIKSVNVDLDFYEELDSNAARYGVKPALQYYDNIYVYITLQDGIYFSQLSNNDKYKYLKPIHDELKKCIYNCKKKYEDYMNYCIDKEICWGKYIGFNGENRCMLNKNEEIITVSGENEYSVYDKLLYINGDSYEIKDKI